MKYSLGRSPGTVYAFRSGILYRKEHKRFILIQKLQVFFAERLVEFIGKILGIAEPDARRRDLDHADDMRKAQFAHSLDELFQRIVVGVINHSLVWMVPKIGLVTIIPLDYALQLYPGIDRQLLVHRLVDPIISLSF